jgi:hypothetical protein
VIWDEYDPLALELLEARSEDEPLAEALRAVCHEALGGLYQRDPERLPHSRPTIPHRPRVGRASSTSKPTASSCSRRCSPASEEPRPTSCTYGSSARRCSRHELQLRPRAQTRRGLPLARDLPG